MGNTARKPFAVHFGILDCWSVSFFRSVSWQWPSDRIHPLGKALKRIQIPVESPNTATPIIEKISFGGDLSILPPEKRGGYKGRLFKANSGHLIYSKIRVKQGSVCVVPPAVDWVAVSSEYPVYKVDSSIAESAYIELVLRSAVFQHYLDGLSHGGSTKTRIHPDQFEAVQVPIPPLPVQRQIVGYWQKAQASILRARDALGRLVSELDDLMVRQTRKYTLLRQSNMFSACFSQAPQWDVKAGRAGVFKEANPSFVRLGDYTQECAETVKPWEFPTKSWPIYGVNNKGGVFLSTEQETSKFNAAYKRIEKDWFFHNPTRANVGSLGIVPEVPDDAVTSPEYQVWRLTGGFLPQFMDLLLQTEYFLTLVSFNRVGGVKQRMYYANLAEIRLPLIPSHVQEDFVRRKEAIGRASDEAGKIITEARICVEQLILGTLSVEDL